MKRTMSSVGVMLLASTLAIAAASADQAKRIHEAAAVLDEIRSAWDKSIPEELWEKAACVTVIPSVKKAAFVIGGEYGKGLMSCRRGKEWSAPSFVKLEKGSVGFQIGGESVDLVLLVMNERGVERLLQDKVTLGGEASIAGGPVGRDVRAMTDAQMKAEILSYSRSQGLFAGIDLTGGVMKPDTDDNTELYGRAMAPRDILIAGHVRSPRAADAFMVALKRTIPARGATQQQ